MLFHKAISVLWAMTNLKVKCKSPLIIKIKNAQNNDAIDGSRSRTPKVASAFETQDATSNAQKESSSILTFHATALKTK